MTLACWMCNCFLLLPSINMHNDLLISLPPLLCSSPCRSSAWWPQKWCRDTRSFSLNGVSQSRSSSASDISYCSSACGQWLSIAEGHVGPPVPQGCCTLLWRAHKRRRSCLARAAELLLPLSGISLPPNPHPWILSLLSNATGLRE